MRAGVITGSGSYDWPCLTSTRAVTVSTRYGDVDLTEGTAGDTDIVHLARHEAGHARLSHQVQHRANLSALLERRVDFVISLTVCGALDPGIELGSLVAFDDLYFPSNRLPDGSPCTWHDTPGAPGRGHSAAAVRDGRRASVADRDNGGPHPMAISPGVDAQTPARLDARLVGTSACAR